jgi:hypothetical protein
MEETKNPKHDAPIKITVDQLRKAVEAFDLLLPSEIQAAYQAMLLAPELGVRIAQALQGAMVAARKAGKPQGAVLDAAILPAFLVGLLAGIGQQKKPTVDQIVEALKDCCIEEASMGLKDCARHILGIIA